MNNINDLQEQFENLIKQGKELIEKMKKEQVTDDSKKAKRWMPKDGETYWYIYGDGTVDYDFWTSINDTLLGRYKLGNCFKAEEEARKELDRRLAEKELLDMCDWGSYDVCCFIYYDSSDCAFRIKTFSEHFLNPYRFVSIESAKKAIDTLGTEKLKLIFRID